MNKAPSLKRQDLMIVHCNPGELEMWNSWQGGKEIDKKFNIPSYKKLESILRDDKVAKGLIHHIKEAITKKFATGGHVADELAEMASKGRHGDTEIALIGPATRKVFDHIVQLVRKKPSTNPHTKQPEYGSMSAFMPLLKAGGKEFLRYLPYIINNMSNSSSAQQMPQGQYGPIHRPELAGRGQYGMDSQYGNENGPGIGTMLNHLFSPEGMQSVSSLSQFLPQNWQPHVANAIAHGSNLYSQMRPAFENFQQQQNPYEQRQAFQGMGAQMANYFGKQMGGERGGYLQQLGQHLQPQMQGPWAPDFRPPEQGQSHMPYGMQDRGPHYGPIHRPELTSSSHHSAIPQYEPVHRPQQMSAPSHRVSQSELDDIFGTYGG